ncbi:MAG TPA: ectoine/hydroxyectoine ABC transporter substrate-binding protein EhuB [Nocardioidaceae bacterium]|nr:ectoine/hydroxyectoine ABC transporter substrate-binding protein EhuB [Nocardioidaceae bacterium]
MSEPQANRYSRRDLLRYSALGIAAVGGGSFLSACSTTDPGNPESASGGAIQERIDNGDPIRIAIGNEPPYTKLNPDGTVTGAEPDVAKAVLERLGTTNVEGIQTAYESMIPGLTANRWEMVAAGLFMNKSRCSAVSYTSPVIVSTESFALPPGNPGNIQTLDDVKNSDVSIAVLAASFELKTARSLGVPQSKMQTYPLAPDALQAMDDGRVDAILLPTLSLEALKEQQGGDFTITEPLDEFPKTGSGAAFAPDDRQFRDKYNQELEAFKQTEEFARILNKWGFPPDEAREATIKELCATEG